VNPGRRPGHFFGGAVHQLAPFLHCMKPFSHVAVFFAAAFQLFFYLPSLPRYRDSIAADKYFQFCSPPVQVW